MLNIGPPSAERGARAARGKRRPGPRGRLRSPPAPRAPPARRGRGAADAPPRRRRHRAARVRAVCMRGGSAVCNSPSSSPRVGRLFVLLFRQVIQGPLSSARHVCNQTKRTGEFAFTVSELNAITRVFVTTLQIPASHLPSGWMLQSEESGHAFPSNYLLPAIILRIL